jgi:NAD(P)-dependent dehydrogenase (short-subunit alcohol dehydrogenase family)
VDSFTEKLAVVTGGGSGLGRELARQLTAQGCSVAACDLNADAVAETAVMARADARPGVRVSVHHCDVSDEARALRFRDELLAEHATDHVDLVFSNAGIGRRRELHRRLPAGVGAGVRRRLVRGTWRILIGEDAKMIDAAVRATEAADDYAKLFRADPDRCKRVPHSPGAARSRPLPAACRLPSTRIPAIRLQRSR